MTHFFFPRHWKCRQNYGYHGHNTARRAAPLRSPFFKSVTRAKAHRGVLSAIALVKATRDAAYRTAESAPKIDRLSLRHNEEKAAPVRARPCARSTISFFLFSSR
jgi:hypothetical protein